MEDRPVGHARYHRPAVEASAGRVPGRRVAALVLAPDRRGRRRWAAARRVHRRSCWPILFVVPGWVIVRRVAPDLPAPGPGRRGRRRERLPVGPRRERRRAGRRLRSAVDRRRRPADRRRHRGLRRAPPSVAGARRPTHGRRDRRATLRDRLRRLARSPSAFGLVVAVVLFATAGARRPTAGCPAAGTGATCSSTSRSAPASCTGTSRRRSPTSPGRR